MIWLEIISTRAAGIAEADKVFAIYREILQSLPDENLLNLAVFCNTKYPTDISLHLLWKSNPGDGSILGREVRSALGHLGLINHTTWIQKEEVRGGGALDTSPGKSGLQRPRILKRV
jgi:hypothetical protein